MGQKINPHGFRVGVIKDWDSRWYARNDKVGDLLVEDKKIRDYLKKTLYSAGIPKIEIERDNAKVRVYLHCARPGFVIGKGGEEINRIQAKLTEMVSKPVDLKIIEVKNVDMDAQLVAEGIAQQLEKRIGFRRAMKNAMGRAMRAGARGIKTCVSGRLGGAEIARVEHYHDGTIPLQTLRADIDYGFAEAATTYGRIGVKVWIYKGEVLTQTLRTTPRTLDTSKPYQDRRERPRNDRRPGGFNNNRGGQGGGFNNRSSQGGGYNNNRSGGQSFGGSQGGYNRTPGTAAPQQTGFTRPQQTGFTRPQQTGFTRAPGAAPSNGPSGGYNRGGQGGFNNNRPASPASPAVQANTPKEGGAQ